jgi:hypothetical protein
MQQHLAVQGGGDGGDAADGARVLEVLQDDVARLRVQVSVVVVVCMAMFAGCWCTMSELSSYDQSTMPHSSSCCPTKGCSMLSQCSAGRSTE